MTSCENDENKAAELVDICLTTIAAAADRCRQRGDLDRALAELDLPAVTSALDPSSARHVGFAAASAFGTVDLTRAWHGLYPRWTADTTMPGTARLALGTGRRGGVLIEPVLRDDPVWLLDVETSVVREAGGTGTVSPLLGFTAGGVSRFAPATGGPPRRVVDDIDRHLDDHAALLLGLIAGGARRAVTTAFDYARTRHVGGVPIAQYQAVALRLADLAINGRALDTYAAALAVEADDDPDYRLTPAAAAAIADFAFRIARDAVQTAGGHGYVAGLPFRSLFEQLRALTGALQSVAEARVALAGRIDLKVAA